MTDFLLELRSEEIPARMQAAARAELEKLFRAQMDAAGVACDSVQTWSTPRRLALIASGLPDATEAVSEERKGPRADAPEQALAGFLRSTGLTRDQLVTRDVKGTPTLFAVIEKPGRATSDVLAEAVPVMVRGFSWPKSMRWGGASGSSESLRWVRPLSGLVALFGEALVPCAVDGVVSGFATRGHRFHCPGDITIGSAADYAEKLRACHVIVDHDERASLIRDGATKAAADAGLTLVADEGLVVENAGLTEWPVPLLGRFSADFLAVPPEVIQLTARVNQKYFVVHDAGGNLTNAFVCTANIAAHDGGAAIVAGNEKVLAARLSDARFFWDQDQKKTLAQHAEKLANITFHEKLGTVADKVERVAKLARWLVEQGIVTESPSHLWEGLGEGLSGTVPDETSPPPTPPASGRGELADQAEMAARLCKADLVTEMVGEFPELQGLMGGYYARAEGQPDAVADAIRDHYKPVGQGDDVPTAPVTVAVALADKLDTVVCFFMTDMPPTGSKDPFALRRATIASNSQIGTCQIRVSLLPVFFNAVTGLIETGMDWAQRSRAMSNDALKKWSGLIDTEKFEGRLNLLDEAKANLVDVKADAEAAIDLLKKLHMPENELVDKLNGVLDFFADRLKVQQREAGVRHDLIDAVFALGGEDDLVRLLARVKALQAFMATDDGANLLAGYKRAANILKQAGDASPSRLREGLGEGVSASSDVTGPPPTPPASGRGDLEPAEAALLAAIEKAEPAASAAVAEERFTDAMAALASLRAPIDAFFDAVMINDPDDAVRAYRLGLLSRFTGAVHGVADFSKIEG